MAEEVIDLGQSSEVEYSEIVAAPETAIDYTEQINDCTNSMLAVVLFVGFAIVGFLSGVQIFGRVK